MVNSLIDPTVTYSESPDIDPADLDHDANLYETQIYEKAIVFALGKPKYTYVDNNIVYYSIYLVERDEITMQIGVYEITANEQETIFDKEGDIDLNKFAKPLLFAFTYAELHPGARATATAKASTASATTASAKTNKTNKWIQEFMSSDKYSIIDTKYDGNCFFSVIQLALEENGQEMSIDDMRDILVDNATEDLFQNYKTLYDGYVESEANLTREIKNITKRHKDLTATMKKTKDRNLIAGFEKQSNTIETLHSELKTQRKQVREHIQTECPFMKGIDNLSMLKIKMKTSEYWADTWAISVLERDLNIKIIIFSELNYRENDILNVLQCGQLDETLQERGIFEPGFYVLAAYHGGYHYQLISYNNLKSFAFSELPEEVRHLVVEKCLERMAGPYSIIPDFVKQATADKQATATADKQAPADIEPILITSDKSSASPQAPAAEELSSDLYDNGTVFRFYNNSSGRPLPGKGSGETLGPEGKKAYEELARIPDWRKKLANAWPAELKIDNHKWLSVEHYYQASKFKRNNKAFSLQFSLDTPDSSIAKDVDLAKAAGGKLGKFKGELVRPKTVLADPDFFVIPKGANYSRGEIELETAMRAKFSQHADLKELLLATKKAKLEHTQRGKPAEVVQELMRVRRELKDAS